MSKEEQQTEQKPSLLSRIWTGIKEGVKHLISYIPKGIMLTAAVFGISALIEGATGYHGFPTANVLNILETGNWGALATKFATHLAVGAVLSGAIGGTMAAIKAGGHHVEPLVTPTVGQGKSPVKGESQAPSQGLDVLFDSLKDTIQEAAAPGTHDAAKLASMAGLNLQQHIPNLIKAATQRQP